MNKILLSLAVWACLSAVAAAEPHRRDGLQLRLAVGPGFTASTLDTTGASSDGKAASISTQLSVGWAVRPGLVVGLGTFPMVAPAPSYSGVDAGGQHVSGTGPFVDLYPWRDRGFHGQVGVLFTAGYLDGRDGNVGVGFGFTAGVGHDWSISDRWSIGALARVSLYQLYGVDDSIRLVTPAALVVLTRQ